MPEYGDTGLFKSTPMMFISVYKGGFFAVSANLNRVRRLDYGLKLK